MNRRKKIIQKLTKKAKQAQAKKQPKNKQPYISKADREAMEAEQNSQVDSETESATEESITDSIN